MIQNHSPKSIKHSLLSQSERSFHFCQKSSHICEIKIGHFPKIGEKSDSLIGQLIPRVDLEKGEVRGMRWTKEKSF